MHLHFSTAEFEQRKASVLSSMQAHELDALLMFKQESMYWLTGYDTFGFCFFQCLVLHSNGILSLLTRKPDLRQALLTSVIKDVRVWKDAHQANPAVDLKLMLQDLGLENATIGVEWDSHGLNAKNGKLVESALHDFVRLKDASYLVSELRLIKSPIELDYVRRAGRTADLAMQDVFRLSVPGAWEGDIFAAMQGTVMREDGDDPANENILSSGECALLGRYITGRRHIDPNDEVLAEIAGTYRHYHVAIMRTIRVGRVIEKQRDLWHLGVEALRNAQDACLPGRPIGEIYQAYVRTISNSNYSFGRGLDYALPFSIGYSLGATFAPTWMDYPLLYGDNPRLIEPNMVFFMHMTLRDDASGFSATPGETVIVTNSGVERLSTLDLDFRVNP